MINSIFGWIATGLSSLYRIPQIIKICKTKEVTSLSKCSYMIQTTSYILYIIHGYIEEDYPIIGMGTIAVCQNTFILYLCMRYKKKGSNVDISNV